MSFLDSICCGFGSIILLLVMSRINEPHRLEEGKQNLEGVIAAYQQELNDILGETEVVQRQRVTTATDEKTDRSDIASLQAQLVKIRSEVLASTNDADLSNQLEGRLAQAKESLTEEMRRLLKDYKPKPDEYKIGGIPVDSEYIVFLLDTSGSMKQFAWDRVLKQIRETLDVYPTVKGIQVMNDEGEYLFKSYRKEWMPDNPQTRRTINDALKSWNAYSDSSPREGILAAIDDFYDGKKKISLYVYSDDLARGSINAIVREIDRRNLADDKGNKRVRIHAVAFPTIYEATGGQLYTAAQFATLMRVICERNGGTFVALPLLRDL